MLDTPLWIVLILCQTIAYVNAAHYTYGLGQPQDMPSIEYWHDPRQWKPERVFNGTEMPSEIDTPDFRIEEDTWYRFYASRSNLWYTFRELYRPYRLSPSERQISLWTYYNPAGNLLNKQHYVQILSKNSDIDGLDNPKGLGCYCTTVYKRLTLLAGCAVLTRRHILTTASSTELVLKNYRNRRNLEGILGAWYDINDHRSWNSSYYTTPSRIHYHPQFIRFHQTNHTHPFPFVHDLALWASTYDLYYSYMPAFIWKRVIWTPYFPGAVLCERGAPHSYQFLSSTPREHDLSIIVGFQFMKAFRRRPMPWYKYALKTRERIVPCPKSEWAWFHCVPGPMWNKYGLESGAALHRALENRYWLYDGLIGLNAFSLRLRSHDVVNYFTVLNTHPVLDFIYDSYTGRLPYEYLDGRFWNSQWTAPRVKGGESVYTYRDEPEQTYIGWDKEFPIY